MFFAENLLCRRSWLAILYFQTVADWLLGFPFKNLIACLGCCNEFSGQDKRLRGGDLTHPDPAFLPHSDPMYTFLLTLIILSQSLSLTFPPSLLSPSLTLTLPAFLTHLPDPSFLLTLVSLPDPPTPCLPVHLCLSQILLTQTWHWCWCWRWLCGDDDDVSWGFDGAGVDVVKYGGGGVVVKAFVVLWWWM